VIWKAAGVCGVNPDPFTAGQLAFMLEQRERAEWGRLSALMAHIANALSSERGKAYSPADFDPFALSERKRAARVDAAQLGELLGFQRKKGGT
jgi:hypothetical protein